jgi:hypothetical protein
MARRTESEDGNRIYFSCRLDPKADQRLKQKVSDERERSKSSNKNRINAGRILDDIIMADDFLDPKQS